MPWLGLKKNLHGFVTQRYCRSLRVVKKRARSDRDSMCQNLVEVCETVMGHPRKRRRTGLQG